MRVSGDLVSLGWDAAGKQSALELAEALLGGSLFTKVGVQPPNVPVTNVELDELILK